MDNYLGIGAVAKLLGITPKAIRHYHKIGLLGEAQRSANGYRFYHASDVLRIQRIRRLQTLGLSLVQIKTILGAPDHERSLREVLTALLDELDNQIATLAQRRERVIGLLHSPIDALDQPQEPSLTMRMFMEHFGDQAGHVSEPLRKLDTAFTAQLDLVLNNDPLYQQQMRDLAQFIADNPIPYQEFLALGEGFMALSNVAEDSPQVEQLVQRWQHFYAHNTVAVYMRSLSVPATANTHLLGELFAAMMPTHFSRAQSRLIGLLEKANQSTESSA